MKFKPVPPAPDSLDALAAAQRAVPLVPGSEADCCARLVERLDLPDREAARTWLTFLRALELAVETESGFRRLRTDPTPEHVRERLSDRVYGAAALLEILRGADGPLTADAAFERFRERVPEWETYRDPDGWEGLWRERVGHLLDWLALVDLVERVDGGYVAAEE
ncbi:MAG: hypothetical protein ABEJ74_04880 [Haloferacaceae archaeon]